MIQKITLYNVGILLVFASIFCNPFIDIKPLLLWELVAGLLLIVNLKLLITNQKKYLLFIPVTFYILVHSIVELFLDPDLFATILLKLTLLITSFGVFAFVLISEDRYRLNPTMLLKLFNFIVLITCLYGIYQFFGRHFGWPFTFDAFLRFRNWTIFGFYQVSSFFEEPAFYSQFLAVFLFIYLFFIPGILKNIVYILLIIINMLFTLSVTGYVAFIIILLMWFFNDLFRLRIQKSKVKERVVFLIFLLPIIMIIFQMTSGYLYIFERINKEVLINNQFDHKSSSGGLRTLNEYQNIITILKSPKFFFGYGLNYQWEHGELGTREMALNAVTEFVLRWGVVGTGLFFWGLFSEIFRYDGRDKIAVLLFLCLFFQLDGAIAKVSFWLLLGLFFLSRRVYSETNL